VLISATGLVLRFSGWGQNARQRLIGLIADQTAPRLGQQLEAVLSNVQDNATVGGPIGLLTLLFASLVVFVQFDDAMNRIWNVSHPKRGLWPMLRSVLVDRLRAFLMLFGIGMFVVAGFIASMSLSAAAEYAGQRLPLADACR